MAWDQQIVSLARKGSRVTVGEIAQALGLSHASALGRCLRLIGAGDLIDCGGGWLVARPDGRGGDGTAPDAQAKLWKAARILGLRGEFVARDLALVAGASLDYAKQYLRWCETAGHVKTKRRPGQESLWWVPLTAPPASQPPVMVNPANRELRKKKKEQGKG